MGKGNGITFELVHENEKDVKVVPRGEHVNRVSDIEGTALLTDEIKLAVFATPVLEISLGFRRFWHTQYSHSKRL